MSRFRSEILATIFLVLLALGLGHVVLNGFVEPDDPRYSTANRHVRQGSLAWALTARETAHWHPLTWWSLQLDWKLHGKRAGGYHLTSLFLHLASAILLFWSLRLMTGRVWHGFFVAALFLAHPLHVEPVAWVADRRDVLGGFFWMLALLLYAHHANQPSLPRFLPVLAAALLGLLANPVMMISLPFILLLLDYWPLERCSPSQGSRQKEAAWQLVTEKIPLFIVALTAGCLTLWAQKRVTSTSEEMLASRDWQDALVAVVIYLRQAIWPIGLAAHYPMPSQGWPRELVMGSALTVPLILLGATMARKRSPYLLVGWLWYLIALLPAVGLDVSGGNAGGNAYPDRWAYMPLIGIFLLGVWSVGDLAAGRSRQLVAVGAGVILLAACATLSWFQVRAWKDSATLWEHALRVTEGNGVAHNNLGEALEDKKLDEALEHYTRALALNPDDPIALNNQGVVMGKKGDLNEAVRLCLRSLEIAPHNPVAHRDLGVAYLKQARLVRAQAATITLAMTPETSLAVMSACSRLIDVGRSFDTEAMRRFQLAVELNPNFASAYYNMAVALERQGDEEEAIRQFEKALQIDPENKNVLYNLDVLRKRKYNRGPRK